MQKIKNHRLLHHPFTKYTYIGAFISVFTIFALWLLIDVFDIPTVMSSTAVVIVAFFFKYFLYRLVGLMRDERIKTDRNGTGL